MNQLIPKTERKAALFSILGLAVFVALVCSIQLPTHSHLPTREYLDDVALATAVGAMAGAVLGFIWRLFGTFLNRAI